MSTCKYCGKEIMWIREGRKSMAVEMDGMTTHRCEEMKNARKSCRKIEVNEISEELKKQYEDAINNHANKK